MKKTVSLILLLSALFLAACAAVPTTAETETTAEITEKETEPVTETETEAPPPEEEDKTVNYKDVKALWISQYDMSNIYVSGGKQRNKEEFTKLLNRVLDNTVKNHYNTIIFQVRPFADSMYPSEVYPPSYIVTGSYANAHEYDPFEILVEEAHARNLSVQAWINPMRAMLVK